MRTSNFRMANFIQLFENIHLISAIFLLLSVYIPTTFQTSDNGGSQLFKIDGKVAIPNEAIDPNWVTTTRVLVDGGEYIGFLRGDGSFTVSNIPKGSYVIEVIHPAHIFEQARVDITTTGKIRARRVNNVQPSLVSTVQYPLKFKPRGNAKYFQMREQWKITDFLFNHMVLMMVLPFLVIVLLPKLVNTSDPETQKEMQSQMNMLNPRQQMPEVSEMFTNWFGGGGKKSSSVSKAKPRKQR
ncbi:endoplasmic reticulum membrane protein complex subunit 7-like [Lineus longissimus]|uniref:endoplasmic reticulum membrane protein complex subunit 7-like n=1 Tax=Lineus longissimus TaxID=88925 RepID=UPI00315DFDCD